MYACIWSHILAASPFRYPPKIQKLHSILPPSWRLVSVQPRQLLSCAQYLVGGHLEEALAQYKRSKEYGVERAAMHIRNVGSPPLSQVASPDGPLFRSAPRSSAKGCSKLNKTRTSANEGECIHLVPSAMIVDEKPVRHGFCTPIVSLPRQMWRNAWKLHSLSAKVSEHNLYPPSRAEVSSFGIYAVDRLSAVIFSSPSFPTNRTLFAFYAAHRKALVKYL